MIDLARDRTDRIVMRGVAFALMPSACPYGRTLTPTALKNYETMADVIERQ